MDKQCSIYGNNGQVVLNTLSLCTGTAQCMGMENLTLHKLSHLALHYIESFPVPSSFLPQTIRPTDSLYYLLPAELPAQEPWLPSNQAQAPICQCRSDPNCWSICLSCYSDEGTPLPRLYLSEIPKAAKYLHGREDCLFHHSSH